MNDILAIFDTDTTFAQRLCQKLNSEEDFPYSVVSFTEKEKLKAFSETQEIGLLLIQRELEDADTKGFRVKQTVFLTDVRGYQSVDARPILFKYQPVYRLKEELLKIRKAYEEGETKQEETITRCAVFGVVSPWGDGLSHCFSVVLGQLLSQSAKVLYVNLEPFAAYGELFEWDYDGDFAELVYEKSVRKNLPELTPYLLDFHGLQILAPIRLAEDCSHMEPKEVFETIREIGYREGLDVVILNLGSEVRYAESLIPLCERVYVPVAAGSGSERKVPFYEFLRRLKGSEKQNPQEVKLPSVRSFKSGKAAMEQLLWSELGDAVRKQLGEVAEWTF